MAVTPAVTRLAEGDTSSLVLAAIVNDGPLAAWVHRALWEAASQPGVRLALLLARPRRPQAESAALSWLGRGYAKLDRWWFTPTPAIDGAASEATLPGAPAVVAWPSSNADYARVLREQRIDAVFDLSDHEVAHEVDAPLGTWRVSHEGASAETAALTCVLGGETTTHSALHSLATPSRVLVESFSGVELRSVSIMGDALRWKSVSLVCRGVRRLQMSVVRQALEALPPLQWTSPVRLSVGDFARLLWTYATRVGRRRWRRRDNRTRWILLSGRRDGTGISEITRHVPPDGHYWGDPFVATHDGARYVFYEDYRYDLRRGHIAVAPLDLHGQLGPSSVALERPYHLSYPFVFQHQGSWYMVPESQANRTIEVYRCERFPDRWQFSHVLMRDVRAVDATFVQHGGRWWLFANVAEFAGSSTHDELFAFWADDPLSTDWRPHPLNPVLSDVGRARPAGRFVCRDGRLFRPSQDCSGQYGGAVCWNEVVSLTETVYEERCIGRFEATWDPHVVAMHTVTEDGDLVLLDGKLRGRLDRPAPAAAGPGRCSLTAPRPHARARGAV